MMNLGKTLGEALLAPTRIYVKALKQRKRSRCEQSKDAAISQAVDSMRIFRECFRMESRAVVKKDSYEVPAIFNLIAKTGNIAEEMMYNTFNMGIGMVVAVDEKDVDATIKAMQRSWR